MGLKTIQGKPTSNRQPFSLSANMKCQCFLCPWEEIRSPEEIKCIVLFLWGKRDEPTKRAACPHTTSHPQQRAAPDPMQVTHCISISVCDVTWSCSPRGQWSRYTFYSTVCLLCAAPLKFVNINQHCRIGEALFKPLAPQHQALSTCRISYSLFKSSEFTTAVDD